MATTACLLLSSAAAAPAETTDWQGFSSQGLAPWIEDQLPDGNFADDLRGGNAHRYAQAALGYGLLRDGLATGNRQATSAGIRAVTYIAQRPEVLTALPSVFEIAAVAGAYNAAVERLGDDEEFRAVEGLWADWLRQVRAVRLDSPRYSNKTLVEAVALLELVRTGLVSDVPGTVLSDPAVARRKLLTFFNERLPALVRKYSRRVDGRHAALLSDPPFNPIAYHGLTAGLMARALRLLGDEATPALRDALVRMVEGSLVLAAPDGAVAYAGRSQEQAWALVMTAAAAEEAAGLRPARAATYRALAARVLERLEEAHGVGAYGFNIVPLMKANPRALHRGVDVYASAPVYNGLTAMGLRWFLDANGGAPLQHGPLPADRPATNRVGVGTGRFDAVRRGRIWFAVRPGERSTSRWDLRADFGVAAAKIEGADGRWRDLLPLRPLNPRHIADSAGPVLLQRGRVGYPFATRSTSRADGTLVLRGGFRTSGGTWLRRGVRFYFDPTWKGLRISWPARRGDRFELSTFLVAPRRAGNRLLAQGVSVHFPRARLRLRSRSLASAVEPDLRRTRLLIRSRRDRPLVLEYRVR